MADIAKTINDLERWTNEMADECPVVVLDALKLLKEQQETIERLEHDLAITQNNLNFYLNGNE